MKRLIRSAVTLSVAMALLGSGTGVAEAHVPADYVMSFSAGLMHPLTGVDHLLALLAIGLWAGGRRDMGLWPTALLLAGTLIAGFASGILGFHLPFVEPMLLTSVLMLGLLASFATALPRAVGIAVIMAFAFVHGHAHGIEAAGGSVIGFLAGFLATSLCLTGIGHALGRLDTEPRFVYVPRVARRAIVVAGLALLVLG